MLSPTLEKIRAMHSLDISKLPIVKARVEKMFGSEESTQKIVAKRKTTSQERYGADHIMKTQEGIDYLETALEIDSSKHYILFEYFDTANLEKQGLNGIFSKK